MAKKILLETRSEPAFYTLIGISCHLRDYRISFLLNKELECNLVKQEDLRIQLAGKTEPAGFSFYFFRDEDMRNAFSLLSNRNQDQVLLPELKQVDFLLLVEGELRRNRKDSFLRKIRAIPNVLMASDVKFSELKNIEFLLTELELHMMRLSRSTKRIYVKL